MKRFASALLVFLVMMFTSGRVSAQTGTIANPTLVIPAASIAGLLKDILPFEIVLGKHLPRNLWIQSVDHLKIKDHKFEFTVLILGEDIRQTLKFGDQSVLIDIGKVNLSYQCEALFRFDPDKGVLFITPKIKDITSREKKGQGNQILSPLLEALSDIEYPVNIREIQPIVTRLGERTLTMQTDITKVYAADNRLFIEVAPKMVEPIQ